jgi:regulator of protease activity HflC (stomatin/prohibitin superfamily)
MEIVVIAFVVLIVIIVMLGAKRVPQGMEFTVERLGRYTKTLSPGFHVIMPVIDVIGSKVNVMEQVMGSMNLDDLLSQRDEINSRLLYVVDDAASSWGIKVTRIEIKEMNPPQDLVDSMARQMKAEREKRAQILEAEGKRQSHILVAEGQKQAQILEAEGEREAAFREAEGRERLAQAEAMATEVVSSAIRAGDSRAINYFVAQKYTEALKEIGLADNQKLVMLPLEASSLIGSIAGIGEISREVFGDREKR